MLEWVVIRARKEKLWLFPTLWPLAQQIIRVVIITGLFKQEFASSNIWKSPAIPAAVSDVLASHQKSSRFLMKVRFLRNRKTSVINTVQIFVGPSWQYAASSLPFLIGTECPRTNATRRQQTKRVPECQYEGHWHIVSSDVLRVRRRKHDAGSSWLFQDLCQTLWYMLSSDSVFPLLFSWKTFCFLHEGHLSHRFVTLSWWIPPHVYSVWSNST